MTPMPITVKYNEKQEIKFDILSCIAIYYFYDLYQKVVFPNTIHSSIHPNYHTKVTVRITRKSKSKNYRHQTTNENRHKPQTREPRVSNQTKTKFYANFKFRLILVQSVYNFELCILLK